MSGQFEISADLNCVVDDTIPVSITGEGANIRVGTSSLRDLVELSKRHTPSHKKRVDLVKKAHLFLKMGGLSASLLVAGREVAVLSSSYHGGFISRLLGLGPLQLKPVSILLSLFGKSTPPK